MKIVSQMRKKIDPVELRAILSLQRDGWTPEEIRSYFGLSRATYYRRLTELKAFHELPSSKRQG
jgi:DNA invertase Pin-like site-specific DNA recombinase